MWEVWDVMLMRQIPLLQAFEDLKSAQGRWPQGFVVRSSEAVADDPMMTRVYLSAVATDLTQSWPANSFTRAGFVETVPEPYATLLANPGEGG